MVGRSRSAPRWIRLLGRVLADGAGSAARRQVGCGESDGGDRGGFFEECPAWQGTFHVHSSASQHNGPWKSIRQGSEVALSESVLHAAKPFQYL